MDDIFASMKVSTTLGHWGGRRSVYSFDKSISLANPSTSCGDREGVSPLRIRKGCLRQCRPRRYCRNNETPRGSPRSHPRLPTSLHMEHKIGNAVIQEEKERRPAVVSSGSIGFSFRRLIFFLSECHRFRSIDYLSFEFTSVFCVLANCRSSLNKAPLRGGLE